MFSKFLKDKIKVYCFLRDRREYIESEGISKCFPVGLENVYYDDTSSDKNIKISKIDFITIDDPDLIRLLFFLHLQLGTQFTGRVRYYQLQSWLTYPCSYIEIELQNSSTNLKDYLDKITKVHYGLNYQLDDNKLIFNEVIIYPEDPE